MADMLGVLRFTTWRPSTATPARRLPFSFSRTLPHSISGLARLKAAGCCILITPTMPLLPITLVIGYSGRRLRQLRTDSVRRDSHFDPAGDYLVDDLRALRIPIPSFVHISSDCEKIEYTWSVSSLDIRRSIVSLCMPLWSKC